MMSPIPVVSVIVPIFNAERYLTQCIISIINQTYRNLEIILLDDGSTDKSGDICDSFKKRDSRVIVIHQSNIGLVRSWKKGTNKSSGELICYVDADDYMQSNYIQSLVNEYLNTKADLVIAPTLKLVNKQLKPYCIDIESGRYDQEEIIKNIIPILLTDGERIRRGILPNRWGRLFTRQIVISNMKYVPDEATYAEDFALFIPTIMSIKTLAILHSSSDNAYVYRISNSSMVRGYDKNRNLSIQEVYENLFEISKENNTLYTQLMDDCMVSLIHSIINEAKSDQAFSSKLSNISKIENSSLTRRINVSKDFKEKITPKERILFFVLKRKNSCVNVLICFILYVLFNMLKLLGK